MASSHMPGLSQFGDISHFACARKCAPLFDRAITAEMDGGRTDGRTMERESFFHSEIF